MTVHPIGEVLGEYWRRFPTLDNITCPFKLPEIHSSTDCRKVSVSNPLSVCSHREELANETERFTCLCPYRFFDTNVFSFLDRIKQFHFDAEDECAFLPEVSLSTIAGDRIGNIDGVMVRRTDDGGFDYQNPALVELQAVYVSGTIRTPYEWYLQERENITESELDYDGDNYPRPDFTSSHRKRLFPQLQYKYNALENAGRNPKFSVVCDLPFWESLGEMPTCDQDVADIHWIISEIRTVDDGNTRLHLHSEVYSRWRDIEEIRLMPTADLEKLSSDLERKAEGTNPARLLI